MAAGPARKLAFGVLRRVNGDGAYANLALNAALAAGGLDERDAAFATELAAGTIRGQGTYDAIIAAAAGRGLNTLQPAVVDLLRLGAHQILSLSTPVPVAVATTVDLAAATVGRRATGVVNAILRQVAARDLAGWTEALSQGQDDDARLALATFHPRWIVQAFRGLLPALELEAALQADNTVPATALAVRPGLAGVKELLAEGAAKGRWSPYAATTTGDPGRFAAVRQGRAGVEDEGSQLVALGLSRAQAPAGPWLDLCAGPGGKTALLAGLAAERGERLTACEISASRARLVREAVRAYPEPPAVVVADGRRPPFPPASFARVLADVPCTGVGALRRRPDARWRKTPADLAALVPLQQALLRSALDLTRPGGVVCYSTCSPLAEETTAVVESVLQERGDAEVIRAAVVWAEVGDSSRGPYFQLWPHRHATDAMFAALLRRR